MRNLVNIFVLFPKQENGRAIRNILIKSGFNVTAVCVTGSQAIQRVEDLNTGLVICGYKFSDMLYDELRDYLPSGVKMLLMASQMYLDECYMDNVVCMPMPVKAHDLIENVGELVDEITFAQKKEKNKPKQRTREEVELLEEVKKLLMSNNQISEDEAHTYIQQRSMNSGVGLIEMARMIRDSLTY
ncbi:MAG: ANTAR domain-containing protein [Anaerostipes sp.]|nr:ANTAR domain-containing protein [Anaerostipes sp.]